MKMKVSYQCNNCKKSDSQEINIPQYIPEEIPEWVNSYISGHIEVNIFCKNCRQEISYFWFS